jgi:hypothetical protein
MSDRLTLDDLAEIAEHLTPSPTVTHVHADPVHGHIVLTGAPEHSAPRGRDVAFVDLGSVLQVWSGQGADLTPEIARQLGEALVAWADKKNPPPFDLMVTLTGEALEEITEAVDGGYHAVKTLRLALDEGTFKIKTNERSWSPPITDGVLVQKGHEIP